MTEIADNVLSNVIRLRLLMEDGYVPRNFSSPLQIPKFGIRPYIW